MKKHCFAPLSLCTLALAAAACGTPMDHPDGGDGGTMTQCQNSAPATLFTDTATDSNVLYVDRTSGDDANDGSRGHPFRTIARATTGRAAGDHVHIAAGTYFECMSIQGAVGTAEHPITFTGDGEVRIHCMDGEAVAATGAAYLVIEHIIVLSSPDDANAIHIDGNSHHVVIRNNEVAGVGAGGDCVKVNASDDIWILDNDLHDADTTSGSSQGIDIVGVHRAVVRGNHVHDILDSQAIFAKGGSSDIVIERNRIERLVSMGADAIGIVLGGVTDRIYFTPVDSIYEGHNIIARNNVIIGADGAGIGAQGCSDCWIVNNTLWNTGHRGYAIQLGAGATGMGAGGDGISANHNVHVINNLVGNPFGTMRAPIQAEPAQRDGLELSNNWWWNGPRDDVFDPGYNHDVGVDETHSHLNEDPLVLNAEAETPDVHLAPSSPARAAGRRIDQVSDDFDGACRSGDPDLGAYRAQ